MQARACLPARGSPLFARRWFPGLHRPHAASGSSSARVPPSRRVQWLDSAGRGFDCSEGAEGGDACRCRPVPYPRGHVDSLEEGPRRRDRPIHPVVGGARSRSFRHLGHRRQYAARPRRSARRVPGRLGCTVVAPVREGDGPRAPIIERDRIPDSRLRLRLLRRTNPQARGARRFATQLDRPIGSGAGDVSTSRRSSAAHRTLIPR